LIKRVQMDGNMGLVQGWASDLRTVYRAADLTLTAHNIDVRTVRESMACGCPVARIQDIDDYGIINKGLNMNRAHARQKAERLFDPAATAKQFKAVLDAVH